MLIVALAFNVVVLIPFLAMMISGDPTPAFGADTVARRILACVNAGQRSDQ